jgi:Zn-dependent protease
VVRTGTRNGWLEVIPPQGAYLRLHWSLPIGLLVFGRGTIGGALGFFVLVFCHELGHAALVRARGLHTVSIDMHAFGGQCRYEPGWGTELDFSIIAWGGVLAQAVLLGGALAAASLVAPGGFVGDFLQALIIPNLFIMVLNLLPVAGLDGGRAWPLFRMLRARSRRRGLEAKHDELRAELDAIRRRRDRDN